MVNDKYKLSRIYFYLTDSCNLRCKHCWIQPKYADGKTPSEFLKLDLFKKIIHSARPLGLNAVKLTGGEPLLHPQIAGILEFIKNEDLQLTIETNGLLCSPEIVGLISSCKKPFVSVSIDAAESQIHENIRGVDGCFGSAVSGIKNLVAAGLRPQIIMSLMSDNKEQIEPMVDWAKASGAGSIKINIVQPTARGEKLHQTGRTLNIEKLVEIGRWVEMELSREKQFKIIYGHPHAFRPLSKMSKHRGGRCQILGIIGVLANGKYALCGIGTTVADLVFGDAATESLADIWRNHPILKEIREGLPLKLKGVCGDCLFNRACLGSCLAQNYFSRRDLWGPFWYCDEARNAGLFPASRLR